MQKINNISFNLQNDAFKKNQGTLGLATCIWSRFFKGPLRLATRIFLYFFRDLYGDFNFRNVFKDFKCYLSGFSENIFSTSKRDTLQISLKGLQSCQRGCCKGNQTREHQTKNPGLWKEYFRTSNSRFLQISFEGHSELMVL